MEPIGDRVRWARERVGLTLDGLSKASGLSIAALHRIETGAAKPRPTTTRKLATALGVRLEWLTVGEMPPVEKGGNE